MFRNHLVRAVAALSLGFAPAAGAVPSLFASATAIASAHTQTEETDGAPMVGPGSLTVVVEASASDVVQNDMPPPDEWQMMALVGAIGTARYGALSGRAHAEAKSLPASSLLAGGTVILELRFTDSALVVSDTLAAGTPVTLGFRMTLDATAVHFTDPFVFDPDGTGAAARHEVEVRDLDNLAQPSGEGFLLVNSRGDQDLSRMVTFDTAVGHRVELIAKLFVSAGVQADRPVAGVSQGTADVAAGETAELFYEPSGDVRLVSESGHDYVVPEPGRGTLLALAAALVMLRGRKPRRTARA